MAYRIADLRERHGWSQRRLAQMAEVAPSQVHNWEAGKADPSTANMIKLADIFDVTLDYLCGRASGDDEAAKWDKLEVVHTFERLPRDGQILLANIAETIEDTYYALPDKGEAPKKDEG